MTKHGNSAYLSAHANCTIFWVIPLFWVTFHIFCENVGPKLGKKSWMRSQLHAFRATLKAHGIIHSIGFSQVAWLSGSSLRYNTCTQSTNFSAGWSLSGQSSPPNRLKKLKKRTLVMVNSSRSVSLKFHWICQHVAWSLAVSHGCNITVSRQWRKEGENDVGALKKWWVRRSCHGIAKE